MAGLGLRGAGCRSGRGSDPGPADASPDVHPPPRGRPSADVAAARRPARGRGSQIEHEVNVMKSRSLVSCTLLLFNVLAMVGCGDDNPTGPSQAPPPGQSGYEGTWSSSLGPADYPVRRLRFEIQNGA